MVLPKIDYLLIDLLSSCNISCIHCRAGDLRDVIQLDSDVVKKVLVKAKELGVKTVTFSGGEPFLRTDIFELIRLAKSLGLITRVQSNSLLLDEEKISKLKDLGLDYIGTGVDGLRGSHEKLRNKKGSFDKVMKNLDLFKKYGLKVHVEFTATNFNYKEFDAVVELCKKKGVYDLMTRAVIPIGSGKNFEYSLNQDQYKKFLGSVIKRKEEFLSPKIYCQDPISIFLEDSRKEQLLKKYAGLKVIGGCSAGVNMLYVSPLGNVQPCSFLRINFGNVYHNSLLEIFNSKERTLFLDKQLKRDFNEKCGNCKLRFFCGGCRARALYFNKDLWGEDPLCFK
ncbi:hypothetical protein COU61_02725 [Candidatus Pacearchaeota archaeon CG10_big_fil_rev_8_21_14_0_10_35_13]|nr:MAG: hypothetical protein COU61_02725 [Candidatus Pacearchaeota archaeon CG10_big_fil_rev_8_21_14_0_10_35_13]